MYEVDAPRAMPRERRSRERGREEKDMRCGCRSVVKFEDRQKSNHRISRRRPYCGEVCEIVQAE